MNGMRAADALWMHQRRALSASSIHEGIELASSHNVARRGTKREFRSLISRSTSANPLDECESTRRLQIRSRREEIRLFYFSLPRLGAFAPQPGYLVCIASAGLSLEGPAGSWLKGASASIMRC